MRKHASTRPFFTNSERQAAKVGAHASGGPNDHNAWGSRKRALGADAMAPIDACALTLATCNEPLLTAHGVLYDKEPIFAYMLERKRKIERDLRAYNAQQAADTSAARVAEHALHERRVEELVGREEGLSPAELRERRQRHALPQRQGGVTASTMGRCLSADTGAHAADTNFWVPQVAPEAASRLSEPDTVVRCPITDKPLRLKQLYPVKFTRADVDAADGGGSSGGGSSSTRHRYVCPLTRKAISNTSPAAFLRPSGSVISIEAVKTIIQKDMVDPFTDPPTRLREKDIIPLRVEGTGFAARTDDKLLNVVADAAPVPRFG